MRIVGGHGIIQRPHFKNSGRDAAKMKTLIDLCQLFNLSEMPRARLPPAPIGIEKNTPA
jgi:hypothetical protein